MQRPDEGEPAIDLNEPIEATPISMQPPAQGMYNAMPIPDHALPYYPANREVIRQNLEVFWNQQLIEMANFTGFRGQHHLPLARVKRIMKSDPQVKMISADTPAVFAKACEIFILELTLRAWLQAESCNRRTIQRCDVAQAIRRSEVFDFLIDVVPFGQHCVRHEGDGNENFVHEGVASPAADLAGFPLPDMNVPVDMNQIEPDMVASNQIIPPEPMMNPYMTHEEFDLNSALQGRK